MNREAVMKILDIQNAALADEQYKALLVEYEPIHQQLLETLPQLDEIHRNVLMEFLGITAAMHLRLLTLAVDR